MSAELKVVMLAYVAKIEALCITHISKSASFVNELHLPNKRTKSVDLGVHRSSFSPQVPVLQRHGPISLASCYTHNTNVAVFLLPGWRRTRGTECCTCSEPWHPSSRSSQACCTEAEA